MLNILSFKKSIKLKINKIL